MSSSGYCDLSRLLLCEMASRKRKLSSTECETQSIMSEDNRSSSSSIPNGESKNLSCDTEDNIVTLEEKMKMFAILDEFISNKGLLELHTHLMGMGSADFWVSRVMEVYLPSVEKKEAEKKSKKRPTSASPVVFSLKAMIEASGIGVNPDANSEPFIGEFKQGLLSTQFESRMYDSVKDGSLAEDFKVKSYRNLKDKKEAFEMEGIYNSRLIEMLRLEDVNRKERGEAKGHGPLRAMVRNWFQFLDSAGDSAAHTDILDSYRGKFTPEFYPRRFCMKDQIIEQRPEVLGILLNSVCSRYGKSGVNYIEFSVSIGDLLNDVILDVMLNKVFDSSYYPQIYLKAAKTVKTRKEDTESGSSLLAQCTSSMQTTQLDHYDGDYYDGDETGAASAPMAISESTSSSQNPTFRSFSTVPSQPVMSDNAVANNNKKVGRKPPKILPNVYLPCVPSALKLKPGLNMAWRKHVDYHHKPDRQQYYFLGAFTRTKDIRLPAFSEEGNLIYEDHNKQLSPSDAYYKLGWLASQVVKIRNLLNAWCVTDPEDEVLLSIEKGAILGDIMADSYFANLQGKSPVLRLYEDNNRLFDLLKLFAKYLCQDSVIEQMYPSYFNSADNKPARFEQLKAKFHERDFKSNLKNCMVGFDWVGDELGYPYCLFCHSEFIDLVALYQSNNPKFGVRFHAAEGVLRPSTSNTIYSPVGLAFTLHMCILMESLRLYHRKLSRKLDVNAAGGGSSSSSSNECSSSSISCKKNVNMRIGHGVAFLHGYNCEDGKKDALMKELAAFRKDFLLHNNIVSELNPTSNHMLLPDSFANRKLGNDRTLRAFLDEKLPVILCTDDDGIWAIHKCKEHYHHVSVAYEYCQAISNGDFKNANELETMLNNTSTHAFASVSK